MQCVGVGLPFCFMAVATLSGAMSTRLTEGQALSLIWLSSLSVCYSSSLPLDLWPKGREC